MKHTKLVLAENNKPQIVISVRNLVEFLLVSGDIDDRHGGGLKAEAMSAGSRIHLLVEAVDECDLSVGFCQLLVVGTLVRHSLSGIHLQLHHVMSALVSFKLALGIAKLGINLLKT